MKYSDPLALKAIALANRHGAIRTALLFALLDIPRAEVEALIDRLVVDGSLKGGLPSPCRRARAGVGGPSQTDGGGGARGGGYPRGGGGRFF